jgi:hypothetical protein
LTGVGLINFLTEKEAIILPKTREDYTCCESSRKEIYLEKQKSKEQKQEEEQERFL